MLYFEIMGSIECFAHRQCDVSSVVWQLASAVVDGKKRPEPVADRTAAVQNTTAG